MPHPEGASAVHHGLGFGPHHADSWCSPQCCYAAGGAGAAHHGRVVTGGHQLVNLLQETHLEEAIGLVQHQESYIPKRQALAPAQLGRPQRGCDDYVHLQAQCVQLCTEQPTPFTKQTLPVAQPACVERVSKLQAVSCSQHSNRAMDRLPAPACTEAPRCCSPPDSSVQGHAGRSSTTCGTASPAPGLPALTLGKHVLHLSVQGPTLSRAKLSIPPGRSLSQLLQLSSTGWSAVSAP